MGQIDDLSRQLTRLSEWRQRKEEERQRQEHSKALSDLGPETLLLPNDPPAPAGYAGHVHDYRAAATCSDVGPLAGDPFSLGHPVMCDVTGVAPNLDIGLPMELMFRHAAVVGTTGSGKTAGIIVPWIYAALANGFRVVAADVTGNIPKLLQRYASHRGRLGRPAVTWDYRSFAAGRASSWHWLDELTDETRVEAASQSLIGPEPPGRDPMWYRIDVACMRGVLALAGVLPSHTTVSQLILLLHDQAAVSRNLAKFPLHHASLLGLRSYVALPAADYARRVSGAAEALIPLADANFERVTTRSEIRLTELLRTPGLLVVGADSGRTVLGKAAMSLMFNLIRVHVNERLHAGGACPLMLVIDEAPELQDRLDLPSVLALGRQGDVSVVLAMQQIEQLGDEQQRGKVLGNCATLICLPGATPLTADFVSKRLGTRRISEVSMSDSGKGPMGHQTSSRVGPVLEVSEIMHPPFGARVGVAHVLAPEFGITPKPIVVDLTRREFV